MEPAYAVIAAFQEGGLEGHPSVKEMLEDAAGLREHQELFEITVSEFLPLTRCKVCRPCSTTAYKTGGCALQRSFASGIHNTGRPAPEPCYRA